MKRTKRSRKGSLLFLLPIAVVGVVVVYALVSTTISQNGTLVVEAYSKGNSGSMTPLMVSAHVGGQSGVTPFNLTLAQGAYTVEFPVLKWYVTPANHTLFLDSGKTAYAVGIYSPEKVVIGASVDGFNVTSPLALHNVTPVEWTNTGGQYVVISIDSVGAVGLAPGQTYTDVFKSAGSYSYSIIDSSIKGTVTVT